MMVKPNDDATLLNVVFVVEPSGTYTVLFVPVLFVTK